MTDELTLSKQLDAVVSIDQQPTLYDLYLTSADDEIQSLFTASGTVTSQKTIVVYGPNQFFGNAHSALVIGRILEMTPTAYMRTIESLCLNRCGFIAHELYTDGHVCKHPDRESYLDCAHSIARKALESAMALVAHEEQQQRFRNSPNHDDVGFEALVESDHGIARLDRALGELARGPRRADSVSAMSTETGLVQINEQTAYHDLIAMLPVLGPELKRKQTEYGEALLLLAKDIRPRLFRVLRQRLLDWQCGSE